MTDFLYVLISFPMAIVITRFLINSAIKKGMIDIPNHRSSHSIPTPRGGGLSIVFTFLLSIVVINGLVFEFNNNFALFISGMIVAIVGYVDDHDHVDAKIRILFHFLAAVIIVYSVGGLPELNFWGFTIDFGVAGYILASLLCVWVLNLYNFMDGIDGIAGAEGTISCGVMGLLVYYFADAPQLVMLHLALALSCLGFLVWNYPPAKIFMGDAGSGFLGLMLAGLVLYSGHISESFFWAWLIMLGVFIVDATLTLIRRVLRGEKPHEAHRSHAYQFASRHFGEHKKVTNGVILINLCWLAPFALLTVLDVLSGFVALLISYAALAVLALKFNAGAKE